MFVLVHVLEVMLIHIVEKHVLALVLIICQEVLEFVFNQEIHVLEVIHIMLILIIHHNVIHHVYIIQIHQVEKFVLVHVHQVIHIK